MKNKKLIISEDFKEILINEGIDPLNVVNFTTENDKNKKIITTITLIDGTEHKIIDNFVWYAARKKQYYE